MKQQELTDQIEEQTLIGIGVFGRRIELGTVVKRKVPERLEIVTYKSPNGIITLGRHGPETIGRTYEHFNKKGFIESEQSRDMHHKNSLDLAEQRIYQALNQYLQENGL